MITSTLFCGVGCVTAGAKLLLLHALPFYLQSRKHNRQELPTGFLTH